VAIVQSTNHNLVLIDLNLAHLVLIVDMLWSKVYDALKLRLVSFVVYSAVNVDKVRECHIYIIYIKIVLSNICRSKII